MAFIILLCALHVYVSTSEDNGTDKAKAKGKKNNLETALVAAQFIYAK